MPNVVPESLGDLGEEGLAAALGEALDALLECTGAAAGWVGLTGPEGRLTFPAVRGSFSPAWLDLQQGRGVWGFEIREGPSLHNHLPALPALGEPPLTHLLTCPITCQGVARGHVLLANKPGGFNTPDSSVLLGVASLMSKWLSRARAREKAGTPVPAQLLRRVLDRAGEAVLVMDAAGTLVLANAVWCAWTGFASEELINRPAPFPFWISHQELLRLGPAAAGMPSPLLAAPDAFQSLGVFPFRHRSGDVFWCQVSTRSEELDSKRLTLAFLKRVAVPPREPVAKPMVVHYSVLDLAQDLPIALTLTDRSGQVLWANSAFTQWIAPVAAIPGLLFRACFAASSAAELEHLFRAAASRERGQIGRLILQRVEEVGGESDLVAYWFSVDLPDGPGLLFACCDDWETLCPPDDVAAAWQRGLQRPGPRLLALLLQPNSGVQFWDERWQALTGLTVAEAADMSSEIILDWIFPDQEHRDRVADLLHQPIARGAHLAEQAVLKVQTRAGSRPLLCTFLPLPGPKQDRWLLLVGTAESLAGEDNPAMASVRSFALGLAHLLNHSLAAPLGAVELALDRTDLPTEQTALFEQVLESCQRLTQLIGLLQDLGATTPGNTQLTSLAGLVREFLDEQTALSGERSYQLKVSVQDAGTQVRVNRRMVKTVLGHLLSNAEQALVNTPRQQIEVRVFAHEKVARCEIEDTGEGLQTTEWARALVPFYSTKGPFARDAFHARLEGTGLGLTVAQHLLTLHGGRLELRSNPGEGTTAAMLLPRSELSPAEAIQARAETKRLRADVAAEPGKPHLKPELAPALEPPAPGKEK